MKRETAFKGRCLAVLGTGSDVGKSVVCTAICRALLNSGVSVAPFKAQNMSNNSGVTPDGLEMGRAQIVQAEAAGLAPHVDMNPVLLKPTSDAGSQVVLLGRVVGNASARDYHAGRQSYFAEAAAALDRLRAAYAAVVLEGAGSCAEMNLLERDIVNLPMAAHAEAPVILVADIHRGGVFAQVVGTLACLPERERERIRGVIINRFRGDARLFEAGVRWIERRAGVPILGVLPWLDDVRIEPEDSVVLESPSQPVRGGGPAIAIVRLPHIANFNDFDPLLALDALETSFLTRPRALEAFRAVILPGSKNTRRDLEWLHESGWSAALLGFVRRGGRLLGICGGYQMLGREVRDPQGLEGAPGSTRGLGLLPLETVLQAPKTTSLTRFSWEGITGLGYEIHMGATRRGGADPLVAVEERNRRPVNDVDGAVSADGRILGTYLHGLFDTPEILAAWLARIGLEGIAVPAVGGLAARNGHYDRLAAHFRRHVDFAAVRALLALPAA